MPTCYRHPRRETGVSCSNCGKPICPDCMTATTVGMRCPDCASQRTQVRTARNLTVEPIATYALVALNVVVYLYARQDISTANWLVLSSDGIANGHYWELVTSGFMHDINNYFHILFNMLALFSIGRLIEPALGHARFLAIYFASLLCGSFGVVLLQPHTPAVGASGAIFGIFGAAIVMGRNRNIDLVQSGLLPLLIINLVITFIPSFHIAWGGHVGGLIGGVAATIVIEEFDKRRIRSIVPGVAFCAALGVAAVIGAIAVS